MAGVRRRKSRRKATINCTNYGKKRKTKTKLPPNIIKSVKEKWDHKRSLKQNLKSLDLVYSANEVLPIAAHEAAVPMEESDTPSTGHQLPTTSFTKELASTTEQRTVHITPNKAEFLQTMMSCHNDDYEKMARDKRNIYQLTPGQLRKQCIQFLASKQHTAT